jgi:hypothetical protein
MSSEFGYIPESPEQSFGNNKGILTPNDIYDLSIADKYTNYGQLELIETQTPSGVSSVSFTDLQIDKYDVFFLTYNFHTGSHDVGIFGRFGQGTSYRDSNNMYANYRGEANGTFANYSSASMWAHQHANLGTMATDEDGLGFTGYAYLYNMGDSTKYSFITVHNSYSPRTNNTHAFNIGGGTYPVAEMNNSYSIFPNTGNFTGNTSMYGIRYS